MCSSDLLAGLDPIAAREVSDVITEVASLDELNTILIVTHDIEAVLRVADTLHLVGCDRDVDGRRVPGARIQDSYDLASLGLVGATGVGAGDLAHELRARFAEL